MPATAPKIPPEMITAIAVLSLRERELDERCDGAARRIAWLQRQLEIARADRGNDSKRKLTELANELAAVHSDLDYAERGLVSVRRDLGARLRAADLARRPVDALEVKCPGCKSNVTPRRTRSSGSGYRSGEYDCAACDAQFSARWGGGIEPAVSIREL